MELIKVTDSIQERYEKLVWKKMEYQKKALSYQITYQKNFGDFLLENYKLQILVIELKKKIAFCQRKVNQGKKIILEELKAYISEEMALYQEELEQFIKEINSSKLAKKINSSEAQAIKKLYRNIAKSLHPDLHPEFEGNDYLKTLWLETLSAYERNDLESLEEVAVIMNQFFANHEIHPIPLDLAHLEEKCMAIEKEIITIMNTNPYLYKKIVEDDQEMEKHRQEFKREKKGLEEYREQLELTLSNYKLEKKVYEA